MASIIEGFNYNIFISYRQEKEWENGGIGEGEKKIIRYHKELVVNQMAIKSSMKLSRPFPTSPCLPF